MRHLISRPFTVAVSAAAGLALLASCSGGSDQSQSAASPSSEQSSAAAPSASAATSSPPASSAPASPSASEKSANEDSTAGTKQMTFADGAITWTMPCATPREETFKGNARDQKRYVGGTGWLCGAGTKTSGNTGVFIVELRKAPADDDAAHRELAEAAGEVLEERSKPKHGTFQGHPSVSTQVETNGREVAMQGVSFGPYLVLFLAVPADNLEDLTDSVTIRD